MTEFTATARLQTSGLLSAVVPDNIATDSPVSVNYSGILINQNGQSINPEVGFVELSDQYFTQEFYLPTDFARGSINRRYPRITGIQICVGVDEGYADTASIDYYLHRYIIGYGWQSLVDGTHIRTPHDADYMWMPIHFNPIEVLPQNVANKYRIGIKGRSTSNGPLMVPVEYDGSTAVVEGRRFEIIPDISPSPLEEGKTYPFSFNGVPSLLYLEPGTEILYYSVQQGINKIWYTVPNPLNLQRVKAFEADGVTPVLDNAREVSFKFKLLGGVADEGVDHLGNAYRSVVVQTNATNLDPNPATSDKYWLSKPNPSKFAVESLCFDVRNNGDPVVIDRVLIDPLTPGVFFHIYYSNDPFPGKDEDSWNGLMWTHVPKSFQMNKKEAYALPEPITAKYVKIEFSHLQPKHYAAGNFQKPIVYKKHPSWVLDYFLSIYQTKINSVDPFISRQIEVVYDALDLAFSYYSDDLKQNPNDPIPIIDPATEQKQLTSLLQSSPSLVNEVDPDTLSQIRIAFQPYLRKPSSLGRLNSILGTYGLSQDSSTYSTEVIDGVVGNTGMVSALDRDTLILEKDFPVMYFFIPCRHGYKTSMAMFEHDTGYFVGVKQVAFLRDRYDTTSDESLYIESAGDNLNIERNDFVISEDSWVTFA